MFLLIEEYSDFIKTITESGKDIGKVRTLIERILKTGRSAKVRVFIGLQKTNQKIIDKRVRDNSSNSFLFNVPDKGYADSLFDGADVVADKGWRPVALPKGICIVQLSGENDIFQMKTPIIENDGFLEKNESLKGYMGRE
ncbi:hypothetical protein PP645_001679 [Vibrio vulnificus]|nr:hypothetical protein [Vibrio vulnificus]